MSEDKKIELNIVRLTPGYRWRVFVDGDLKCTGTDYYGTEKEAEDEARELFCKAWEVQ